MAKHSSFDANFDVFLADTSESKAIHHNIRYQVYCDEMGFEDKDSFPDQLEFDQWDKHSVHFLVRDKHIGHWVGALRLVLHDHYAFPMENHCELDDQIPSDEYFRSVELSRLCVLKEVRRFSAKKFGPYGLLEEDSRVTNSSNVTVLHNYKNLGLTVMWGMLRAATLYCKQNDISNLYLLVAPALAVAIRKQGFTLEQIGEPCFHRGQRMPFRWSIDSIMDNSMWEADYKNGFRLFSNCFEQKTSILRFA